jgi:protein involved in temperature-dependent protein secretion
MRKAGYKEDLEREFRKGYLFYISGDWKRAMEQFDKCLKIKPKDGPTNNLVSFIKSEKLRTPYSWRGFRSLNEK